ncbi:T9SS type A sorting domain-containing protein [Candidatus Marinimicrobia bacterium]|nr:T9SS type A sorting domain-containing protein [Candidatus Neomarinimicrobiota bacterium]
MFFVFDEEINDSGNSWANLNGDIRNSRKLELNYSPTSNSNDLILRAYCYPNPIKYVSNSKIRVETYDAKSIALKVYDSNGIFVDEFSNYIQSEGTQISEWNFDITNLESGIYFGHLDVKPMESSGTKNAQTLIKIAVIK